MTLPLYTKRHLLYSDYLCRLIFLICFNLLSVVNVVSGKINFITLLCRELRERERERELSLIHI